MGRKYTVEELKAQDPEKWTDEYIQEWGSRSGKVEGIERGSSGPEVAAADPASGTNHAKDTRGKTEFQVTDSMVEIGQVSAGLSGGIGGIRSKTEGAAVLYDDVTGKIYETTKWKDLDRNRNYLVDAQGRRQRIAGYASGDAEGTYSIYNKGKPGTQWVLAGYNEDIPEAGTQEFQEYVAKKFETSAISQATGNRVTLDEDGKYIAPRTELGQFASISASDYIKLGKPRKFGNFDTNKLSEMSDEELMAQGGLILQDTKDRSHGIEKALNKVGKLWGDSNFGHELMRSLTDLGRVPIIGDIFVNPYVKPINAYEEARDAGESAGSAGKAAGKAAVSALGDSVIAAAKAAAAVAATVATGGAFAPGAVALVAGTAAGVATGAATEFAGTLASHGMNRAIYGSGNLMYGHGGRVMGKSDEMWDNAGKAAAVGAITGGVGAGVASVLRGAGAGWSDAVKKTVSGTVRGGTNYAVQRYGLGAKDDEFLWAGALATGMAPDTTYDYAEAIKANPLLASQPGTSWFGQAAHAFRERASTSNLLTGLFDRNTKTRQFQAAMAQRGLPGNTGYQAYLSPAVGNARGPIMADSAFARSEDLWQAAFPRGYSRGNAGFLPSADLPRPQLTPRVGGTYGN